MFQPPCDDPANHAIESVRSAVFSMAWLVVAMPRGF